MNEQQKLREDVERQVKRMKRAEKERPTILAQSVFLGTLGLVFVLPVVAGAYLGRWIDAKLAGYSMQWTLSMMFLGLIVGAVNVYLLMKGR
ncbi:MAG TPA: AtpZ/AtpI family protein [Gammaproteobacteria bacterium]